MPLTALHGVGPGIEKKLNNLGIHCVQDLLFHLPFRYQDRTRITPIRSLALGDYAQLEGEIMASSTVFGKRRSLQVTISDNTGFINLRFFFFSTAQKNALKSGLKIRCFGEVRRGRSGFEIYHPEYRLFDSDSPLNLEDTLTPVYPTTEGLQQNRLRTIISEALKHLSDSGTLTEYIPEAIRNSLNCMSLANAISILHRPPQNVTLDLLESGRHPAQRRLAFEELLSHRLAMRRLRQDFRDHSAPALIPKQNLIESFLGALPFALTQAQQKVFREICFDLKKSIPMLRLLQGDVGSGKTLVAALSTLVAAENGFQSALMAPTEILAEQHFINFSRWFEPLNIQVAWLSGKQPAAQRNQQLQAIGSGQATVIVGTHALFQASVNYARLGLIIIDEQHRFGVHQRMALRNKAAVDNLSPHQLVMTATPIPRTLAMSAYADLDCSVIDELPPGRTPVQTLVVAENRRGEIITRIAAACKRGSQAYWVCTLVEESEALQCQAAEATSEMLRRHLPQVKVGLVHGRMKSREKTAVMDDFKNERIQLLVATTVIEVGVDVPNASLMVIENPERLGLAQLHQLRGRVGRGSVDSFCILLYQNPLSATGKYRLAVMRESNDGFYIAEKDLEIRGPGQVLGTQQTGMMQFRVADIARDSDLLDSVQEHAETILQSFPQVVDPLVKRWLGDREDYGLV